MSSAGWNFADAWEAVAQAQPNALCQIQGDTRRSWRDVGGRADAVASYLIEAGAAHQDKVALYLYNCPEYLESTWALFKAALVPVNTNYRYADDELVYIWDNSDSVAVVFHGSFVATIERIRHRCDGVRTWLWVDDGSGQCPPWAIDYQQVASTTTARTVPSWGRGGDDLFFLYTGGTTGMPKGVMWRQDDLFVLLDLPSKRPLGDSPDYAAMVAKLAKDLVSVPAAPLMHGTGGFNSMSAMCSGAAIVTLVGRSFDPIELLETIGRERVKAISIVGDAFAKPILRALDSEPDRFDISSLRVVTSSGVMWAAETKAGLRRHNARLILIDSLGSSEAIGMGQSVSTGDETVTTAKFALNASTAVLTEDGRYVEPGSGERGRVALGGRVPLGYYKDEAKSAATFQMVDGKRYSIPGDWATVEADGSITLLGRGSQCINTGGEKVYPEEVEEALKTHAAVADAVVVGVPDDRFGQAIWALVELVDGSPEPADLIEHVKANLSAFKAPKRILTVPSIDRAANGKVDYRRWSSYAAQHLPS